jgi:hypothetical protein
MRAIALQAQKNWRVATKESVSAAFTTFYQGAELFKVVDDNIRT